ncbi:BON domain-containing protein [Paraburkholderia caffeinilytica]|uniref:BON domain-containing protein n=1 Tax=Paraburkholderia caffeinilytica TaxID=1761016 RepID=UPI0038B95E05
MINPHLNLRALFAAALIAFAGNAMAQPAPAPADGMSSASAPAVATAKATKAADRKLAHRVANALERTRGLNAARILVKARDGHVTLNGSVTDNEQVSLAADAARQVDGVKTVENFIRVSGPSL